MKPHGRASHFTMGDLWVAFDPDDSPCAILPCTSATTPSTCQAWEPEHCQLAPCLGLMLDQFRTPQRGRSATSSTSDMILPIPKWNSIASSHRNNPLRVPVGPVGHPQLKALWWPWREARKQEVSSVSNMFQNFRMDGSIHSQPPNRAQMLMEDVNWHDDVVAQGLAAVWVLHLGREIILLPESCPTWLTHLCVFRPKSFYRLTYGIDAPFELQASWFTHLREGRGWLWNLIAIQL